MVTVKLTERRYFEMSGNISRVGTLEEILARLNAQDSRLKELELENSKLRDQVAA